MWPFTRKTDPEEKKPSQWEEAQRCADELRAWRAVGQPFEYLGRRMIVVAHSRIEFHPGISLPAPTLLPGIKARYADDSGVVHTIDFSEAESRALAFGHSPRPPAFTTAGVDVGADRLSATFPHKP